MQTYQRFLTVWALAILGSAIIGHAASIEEFERSVVRIQATTMTPDYRVPWSPGTLGRGTGSGFVIAGNRIMTNAHVVSNARFLGVEKHGNPNIFPARVEYIGHDCDLAILKVDTDGFFDGLPPMPFGETPALHSAVLAYGYPIGGTRLSVTRGVVSRIEFRPYAHSGLDAHLTVQIDAAINPGSSGGPVVQDNKVVGVSFQGYGGNVAQNTGYMIPIPVISHFLKDIEDADYDGYVDLSIETFNLRNPDAREAFKLPSDDRGVVVTFVLTAGASHGVLQIGDVLLAIDGHPILTDGTIQLDGDYVKMEEVVERKFDGDKVKLNIVRDGEKQVVEVTLSSVPLHQIMTRHYDQLPRFVLFAGLLFQPLNLEFLQAYGTANPEIMDMFSFFVTEELYLERPDPVVLGSILSDPINTHMDRFKMSIVDTVNGEEVNELSDLHRLLTEPADRYVIRFVGGGMPVVIEAERIAAATERIIKQYGVTRTEYLGEARENETP